MWLKSLPALPVLSCLFLTSAALRLAEFDFMAFAQGETGATQAASEQCAMPPDALGRALSEREARVRAQELILMEREAAVALSLEMIDSRLAGLTAAEETLRKTLSLADKAAEKDIERLVSLYESMRPKDAAPLFEAMDPPFAAGFLGRMRADAAAAVLGGMDPQRAYALSVILAGRNANVPTD